MTPSNDQKTDTSNLKVLSDQTTYSDYYFFINKNQSDDLILIGGGMEHCKPDYAVRRDHYIYYAVEYIASGNCILKINNLEHNITSGSVFAYGPHTKYEIENNGKDPLIKYFVNFTGYNLPSYLESELLANGGPITIHNFRWLLDIFIQIQTCGRTKSPEGQKLCRHLLKYLLARIGSLESTDNNRTPASFLTYQKCRTYLESSFCEISSVSDIAEVCHVTVPYVSRLFKKYSDVSPSNLLMSLKLCHSRELLVNTNLLIKNIAEKIGIDDQYYFSKRFKQYFGLSPQNYKRTAIENNSNAA